MINAHLGSGPFKSLLGALLAVALSACAAGTLAPVQAASATRYICEGGAAFAVQRTDAEAVVQFADGDYRLGRRPSSLGERFSSDEATLIVDGDHAVFVAEDRLDLNGCASSAHVARRRGVGG